MTVRAQVPWPRQAVPGCSIRPDSRVAGQVRPLSLLPFVCLQVPHCPFHLPATQTDFTAFLLLSSLQTFADLPLVSLHQSLFNLSARVLFFRAP